MTQIIIDTNWYISATINQKSRRTLYHLLISDQLNILYSDQLLKEYFEVIKREKFKKLIKQHQAVRFMNLVITRLKKIEINSAIHYNRDPADSYLLSMCLDGQADYLITGDSDLLVLQKIGKTKIIKQIEFLDIFS